MRRLEPNRRWLSSDARVEGVAENGGFDAGGCGDYAGAVAGKVGAVLFAGCVAGVEGEGKDVETECCAKTLKPLRAATISYPGLQSGHSQGSFSLRRCNMIQIDLKMC